MEENQISDVLLSLGSRLEKFAELHEKGLIDDADFQELRVQVIRQMKNANVLEEEKTENRVSGPPVFRVDPLVYGQLHDQIVGIISKHYESGGEDVKKQLYGEIGEIAEKQAIFPGDLPYLYNIVDVVYDSDFESTAVTASQINIKVYVAQISLSSIQDQLIGRPDASPAAKAIAKIAEHSSRRAVIEMHNQNQQVPAQQEQQVRGRIQSLWKALTQADVHGAYDGCLAGVGLVPLAAALAPVSLPVSVPAIAAIGAAIGAGVRSGCAYGTYRAKN